MSLKNILGESNGLVRRQMEETKGLVNKWEKTGLLEGLDKDYDRHGTAILLENQAKQLISEASATAGSDNAEQWAGVALPLVRRIFAEIAAKEFVSVQPMNLPSGLVFYLDFKYGTAQPGFNSTSARTTRATFQNNSVFGLTETTNDANGGLYGAGRFGYSLNEAVATLSITGSTGTITAASASAYTLVGTGNDDDVWNYDSKFYAAYSSSLGLNHFKKIVVSATGFATNADLNGVRAFKISGSSAGVIDTYFPQFTKIDSAANTITFVISGSLGGTTATFTLAAGVPAYVVYQKQPGGIDASNGITAGQGGANGRGDFEDSSPSSTSDINIPEINVEMRSEAIVAKTRKLKAVWTPEFAQDLNAYHSIDAEAELTSMLSEYVSQEIDLEILDMLIQNAVTTDNWSARVGYEYDAATDRFVTAGNPNALAYNQSTWYSTLGTKIQKVSNKIHQKTMRGGANFLVTSPDVCTILESIPGYATTTPGGEMQFAMGVQKVGAIANRFTVYKNPYMTENLILLGYRGTQFLETGAVYAPYIPLIMTPLVYDPTNFTPRKGVMTRYAKKMVRPEFYGLVKVAGLDLV
jgi:hypothetical protein